MLKFKKLYPCLLFLSFAALKAENNNGYYYNVNKSFEVFGSVFRELSSNYIIDVDPELLMEYGIRGILQNLDPYTIFVDEKNVQEFDILTKGNYTGLGLSVGKINDKLTITDLLDDYPARKSGLRVGDVIYKIDTSIVIFLDDDDLRPLTNGQVGSGTTMSVIRPGVKDTLTFKLVRELIHVKNISFYGVYRDSIGYIRLERFTKEAAAEMRAAITVLKKEKKVTSLIIDLRDNPGGLLEAAVEISEYFLPKGTEIVSTRGKSVTKNHRYFSQNTPIADELPLALIINEGSASASEVVAGAIQDQDRGILVGTNSYGKGLVQSVIQLPHNTQLKITTSKYFTPSGRSIQRVDYFQKFLKEEDLAEDDPSKLFFTKNGRTVKQSRGITPDVVVRQDKPNSFVTELIEKNFLFNFVSDYLAQTPMIRPDITVDGIILQKFNDFLVKNGNYHSIVPLTQLREIEKVARERNYSESTMTDITVLEASLLKESNLMFEKNKEEIREKLQEEIDKRIYSRFDLIKNSIDRDLMIQAAADVLTTGKYKQVLATEDALKLNIKKN